jgi:Mn-dependent DtxR family transcriptional regulator
VTLSAQQQAVVRLLGDVGKTAKQIALAVGMKSVVMTLQSLHQQGYIRYHGGKGVKLGRGLWELTDRGKMLAREFGGDIKAQR